MRIMTINYKNSNFGTVTFEGKEYHLQTEAEIDNRIIPGAVNFNDAGDDEEYEFEMSAKAIDDEGHTYTVYWIFTDIKGENGRELDSFNYGDVNRVVEG